MSIFKTLDIRKLALAFSAVAIGLSALWLLSDHIVSNGGSEMGSTPQASWRYEAVPGIFMQDDPATDASRFDYTKHNFGLVAQKYETDRPDDDAELTQWERFMRYVHYLADSSSAGTLYKVIYMGRHGEGFHNVAEAYYGTKAWDDHWSKLDGNGTLFWADAHLTDVGKEQAREAHAFYGEQLAWAKMPAPESYYVSPLFRCLQTAQLTFQALKLPADRPFRPVVKELLREVMGVHTCDRRSTRAVIHEGFPDWTIEPGFRENDELWQAEHRETSAEHDARMAEFLDDVFAREHGTVISFTSHSGSIASLLRVISHREFTLPTGALIPVLVKATRAS